MRASILTAKRARQLRHEASLPERVLWQALKARRLGGLRFRRQHPVGPYILDFYCVSARLAVEIDGEGHNFAERAAKDVARDRWLASKGIRVPRFAAADVLNNDLIDGVATSVLEAGASTAVAPSVGFADSSPVNGGAATATTVGARS
jgi:very-short-patch-repair endonuclease